MIVSLPHKFVWRPHQKIPWDLFVKGEVKNMVLAWHRRAGKTKLCVNILCAAALQRVGTYLYIFPTREQAKDTVWEGRGSDGVRFMDHFPQQLIQKTNNSDLSIKLVNGSIIKLRGAAGKSFNSKRGGNPLGILYDEFAFMDPRTQKPLSLILKENKGWEIIISTPNGHNHFYDLYMAAKEDPEWYAETLTIDDTSDGNGSPIFDQASIASLTKQNGQDWIDQELFCSFDVSNVGAIFGAHIETCYKENRIRNFLINPRLPVYTFWDLGMRDYTCIWFVQFKEDINHIDEILCVDYYEAHNQVTSHYVNYIKDWRDRHNVTFGQHWFPHDGDSRKIDDITHQKLAAQAGLKVECIRTSVAKKDIAINMTKKLFPQLVFNKDKCERGLECLKNYRREYNDTLQSYGAPVHDWSSHGSDALMTLGEFLNEYRPPCTMDLSYNSVMDDFG